jgi:hypothetical protein
MKKKIKEMVESAPNKKLAIDMLNTWRTFGNMSDKEYEQGRELIKKEF